MSDTYGIAELAREFDVTTRTIRFYEDKGLLAPLRKGQRRVYASRDRVRLRLIMRGKRLGFSLDEIAWIIAEARQGRRPTRQRITAAGLGQPAPGRRCKRI